LSETTLGLSFEADKEQEPFLETGGLSPRFALVDENHYPIPTMTYALSKVASERRSRSTIATWSRIPFVALCCSKRHAPGRLPGVPVVLAGSARAQAEPVGPRKTAMLYAAESPSPAMTRAASSEVASPITWFPVGLARNSANTTTVCVLSAR
jgi:hypothetical protein